MAILKSFFPAGTLSLRFAVHDLRVRCVGATLGFVWTFIQPFVMTSILWVVVSYVFKAQSVRGVPCIAWLLAGMSAWTFFADSLNQVATVFCEYSFLVKKVRFNLEVLPAVKIISAAFVHAVFLLIVAAVLLANGVGVSLGWAGTLYYVLAAAVLAAGAGYAVSALNVFMRDVGHAVNVGLQLGFWVTPVFWDFSMLVEHPLLARILHLNPLVYVVEGYRNSLLFNDPFAGGWWPAIYFWAVTLAMLVFGRSVFRKLRPHFADVL